MEKKVLKNVNILFYSVQSCSHDSVFMGFFMVSYFA